jgi:flavodoxin
MCSRQNFPRSVRRNEMMTKVLVVYYSMYGHVETMANAVRVTSENELEIEIARYQGSHVAKIAAKLAS